jgi:hypothetical protein
LRAIGTPAKKFRVNIEESGCFCQEMASDERKPGRFQAQLQHRNNKEAGFRPKIELY